MPKLSLLAGTTSKLIKFKVYDASKTNGAGLTGLTSGTSGLTAYYIKEGQNSTTQISLSGGTLGTWSSGGFIVIDGTNMPGIYEIGIPNLALSSAKSVLVYIQGAANMVPVEIELELTAVDNQSASFGLTTTGWTISAVSGAVGSVTAGVTVTTNNDKTAYVLTAAYDPAKTAAQSSATTAIQAQTDKLTFTVANQIDANIQYVNDTLVNGNGSSGTPWGP